MFERPIRNPRPRWLWQLPRWNADHFNDAIHIDQSNRPKCFATLQQTKTHMLDIPTEHVKQHIPHNVRTRLTWTDQHILARAIY